MSNIDHYKLEKMIKEHVATMSIDDLRRLVTRLVNDGSVNTVHEIAQVLRLRVNA